MTAALLAVPALPEPYSVDEAIDRLLIAAASQIGYREGRSASGYWNNDNAFGQWYGTNGVSWCAQFVSWCAYTAGYLGGIIPKHQYTPTGWNWFQSRGQNVDTPRRGDILYVYGYVAAEGRSRVHHVGIVERVLPDGRLSTIEGNTNTSGSSQGNGVYRLTRDVTAKLRFCRPDYAKVVKQRPANEAVRLTRVSLTLLNLAAHRDDVTHEALATRLAVLSALAKHGLIGSVKTPEGHTNASWFRAAWRVWQGRINQAHRLGWTTADMDGYPGETSARRFAGFIGRRYTP